ncbi:hypothetical protein Tco_1158622, partial [Tanacetum coccineum]
CEESGGEREEVDEGRRIEYESSGRTRVVELNTGAGTAKDDLRNAYEKCNDIPQESRALIDTFLKQESDKDYDMHLAMYGKGDKNRKTNKPNEMTRYLLQKRSCAEEERMVRSLPLDLPLNSYGMHTLCM